MELKGIGFQPVLMGRKYDGLYNLRENLPLQNTVPKGRLRVAQDASPG